MATTLLALQLGHDAATPTREASGGSLMTAGALPISEGFFSPLIERMPDLWGA